jgi:XTP/dITP diphosphohydrolase
VLDELKGIPDHERTARFVCALAIVDENEKEVVVHGTCEGKISQEKRGSEGFGYDPIFYLPQLDKTMAELSKDEKNAFSHRGNAFKKLELVIGELI